jgi:hypothetical protein
VALFLLLATGFGYLGTQGPGPSASNQQNALPAVRMRAIETYQVCDRVLGENPELTAEDRAKFGPEPDTATWKKLELHCPKRDGSWADVTMVQPPSWLAEQGARVGGTVEISVPECGIEGHAQVLSIGLCPPVKRGQGHVVTATFRHHAVSTVHLQIEGSTEPIRCTGNHPFWSEDRRQFVRADALKIGEHLSSLHGPAALVSRTDQPNPHPVFNIQVQGTHVYLVGADGVLVHNGGVCSPSGTVSLFHGTNDLNANSVGQGIQAVGKDFGNFHMTTDAGNAMRYALETAEEFGGSPAVVELQVPESEFLNMWQQNVIRNGWGSNNIYLVPEGMGWFNAVAHALY